MKQFLLFLILIISIHLGCSQYSLVEQNILNQIPSNYQSHNEGIIAVPSDEDIEQAIEFGQQCKDKSQVLDYAYIEKPEHGNWILVKTPLYLIAKHSLEKAQEYRNPNSTFIDYCKNIGVVKIELGSDKDPNYSYLGMMGDVILLRNGRRVEPITEFKAFNYSNPYESMFFNKDIKETMELTNQMMETSNESLIESQKMMEEIYKEMNIDIPIPTFSSVGDKVSLSSNSSCFDIRELNKPGNYEVIMRVPDYNVFSSSDTKEIQFSVSFYRFK